MISPVGARLQRGVAVTPQFEQATADPLPMSDLATLELHGSVGQAILLEEVTFVLSNKPARSWERSLIFSTPAVEDDMVDFDSKSPCCGSSKGILWQESTLVVVDGLL